MLMLLHKPTFYAIFLLRCELNNNEKEKEKERELN